MTRFRVGVIGCGRISVVYKAALGQLAEQEEGCFAVDKVFARAQAFAAAFPGCGASDQVRDLTAAKPDVVHVLTPHFLHKEHVIACLQAGCHVLTEKPIATRLADAEEMMAAQAKSGRQLGVIFQNRYIEGIQEAKRLIEAGAFGPLTGAWSSLNWWRPPSYYECDWKGSWAKEGGGVVIDQAIHSLDLVRYLMGCEPRSIQAHIDRRVLTNIEVEDVADAAITYENGAVHAFFACNYYVRNAPIRVEISGEKGTATLVEDTVTIALEGQAPYVVHPVAASRQGEGYWGGYHLAQLRDFYTKLAAGQPVPIDPRDATRTLGLVLGIYEASRKSGGLYPVGL